MGLFDCSLHLHSYKHLYCKSSLFGLHLSDKKRKSRNYNQSKADDSDSTMNSPTAELLYNTQSYGLIIFLACLSVSEEDEGMPKRI